MKEAVAPRDRPVHPDFGPTLRRLRQLAGYSQVRLASELGYHHSVISRWETGDRKPPLDQLGRVDALLCAEGRLVRLCAEVGLEEDLDQWAYGTSLETSDGSEGIRPIVRDAATWPDRLPHHGMVCPLHGPAECAVPVPETANRIWLSFVNDPPRTMGEDLVHVLTAYLSVGVRGTEAMDLSSGNSVVEHALGLIVRLRRDPETPFGPALTRLAAGYASLAGQLRMLRGQLGAAMSFYERGLRWSSLTDDTGLTLTILCDMNALARLEQDGAGAVEYARMMLATARGQGWAEAVAHLHQARGFAVLGDTEETVRAVDRCRASLADSVRSDGGGPDWITGTQGAVLIESGIAGALRDASVAAADPGLARDALDAAESAMTFAPDPPRPAAVLLGLRLADCHACVGQSDTAATIASPLLAEALAATRVTVGNELRGLLGRLTPRWPHVGGLAHAFSMCR